MHNFIQDGLYTYCRPLGGGYDVSYQKRLDLNVSDIVIHIGETLDDQRIHGLERELGEERGVYSACMHEKTRHLMVVDFDPVETRPSQLVRAVRERGLKAVMVGF